MNPQTIWNLLAKAAIAAGFLVAASTASALPNYGTTTNSFCTTFNQTAPYTGDCALCHVSGNTATRKDPEWTWYQAAPKGASTQMQNFCPPSPANQAPNGTIAAPAANVTVTQGSTVAFQGSGTDPDNNTPLSYSWNFGGGATNSTQQNPSVVFATVGTFTVSLTVTDARGLADPTPATRTVTVTAAANQAPNGTIAAPASNVTIAQGSTVAFQGSGTDPDNNTPLTYSWNFGGGATNSTQQNPSVVFATVGTFTVSLTVTDARGLADPTPATRTVTVTAAANQAPNATIVAPAANLSVVQGGTANFEGSGTDPDNNLPLAYSWNFGAGAVPSTSTAQNPGAVTFNTVGTNTVSFTVRDGLGATSAAVTRVVTVTPPTGGGNQAPNGTITSPASDQVINLGQSASFSGTGTDPDSNTPFTYLWNFGGGAPNSTVQNPGAVAFSSAGTFTVSFTVTDSKGLADPTPATRVVTVMAPNNQPPTGRITAPASDVSILKGASIAFSASGSDPDNNLPLSYRWNFGAGGLPDSTQQNPTVRFDTVGTYSVTLIVTDKLGASDVAPPIRIITVREPLPTGCRDNDKDGFSPDGGVCGPVDCDDKNASINPGMTESCGDRIDNDCNGKVDAADPACNGTDCLAALTQRPRVTISKARWEAEDRKLEVEGRMEVNKGSKAPRGTAANLFDAATGALLGSARVEDDGKWKFEVERLATAPCRVRVDIGGQSVEAAVSGAPSSCSGGSTPPPAGKPVVIEKARWDADHRELKVEGGGSKAPSGTTAMLFDAASGALLGSVGVKGDGQWEFEVKRPATVPCRVRVEIASQSAESVVSGAPSTCSGGGTSLPASNLAPDGRITGPADGARIRRGRSVQFSATGSDPDGNLPLAYAWDFAGGATASTLQNPRVTFRTGGNYAIRMTVKDAQGLADSTPAQITVRVANDD